MVVFENCGIRCKDDFRTVAVGTLFNRLITESHAFFKLRYFGFPFPKGLDLEIIRERFDGFGTDPIKPYGLLKRAGIIFSTRVDFRYAVDYFAQRNTPSI